MIAYGVAESGASVIIWSQGDELQWATQTPTIAMTGLKQVSGELSGFVIALSDGSKGSQGLASPRLLLRSRPSSGVNTGVETQAQGTPGGD